MDAITQGLLGAAAAQALLQRYVGPRAWLYGAIGGMAPDLDILIRSDDPLVGLTYHRHFTHSLSFIPIGGPLSALPWIVRKVHRARWRQIVTATTVGYATHALLDAFTTYGTQLLWPMSDMRVAWNMVSIIDLLFSVPLAIGVVMTARRDRRRPVIIALAWCAAYMTWGGVQRSRAIAAATVMAQERGHTPERIEAFPNAFSNVAWRTAYQYEQTIVVDWVRTPWLSSVQPHAGDRIAVATEQTLPAAVRDDPRTLRAFRVFRWFADGWIAADPSTPGRYGDLRYGVGLGSVESMWVIGLRPGQPEPVTFERQTDKIKLDALVDAIFGD